MKSCMTLKNFGQGAYERTSGINRSFNPASLEQLTRSMFDFCRSAGYVSGTKLFCVKILCKDWLGSVYYMVGNFDYCCF
jgi:hypothetical protein